MKDLCEFMVRIPVRTKFYLEDEIDSTLKSLIFFLHSSCTLPLTCYFRPKSRKIFQAVLHVKPGTPLSVLDYILEKCDTVLLMLINPGYAFVKDESQVSYGALALQIAHIEADEGWGNDAFFFP